MFAETKMNGSTLHDITHGGIRVSIGAIFLVHSLKKFEPSWQEWLVGIGMPAELQIPIALLEFIGGICLITGYLLELQEFYFPQYCLGNISYQMGKGFFCIARRVGMGSCNVSRSVDDNSSRTR